MMLYIGSHVGFSKNEQLLGSLNEALSYGSNTFMFYTGAPQNTMRYEINGQLTKLAYDKMKENNILLDKIIVHAPYIINLANQDDKSVCILLETMAGKGSEVGSDFSEIKRIINGVNKKELIGVCMDTCHMHDSGYDISDSNKLLEEFDNIVGLHYVKCVHINDSKNICGAKKDRHENIGKGCIGLDNLNTVC